MEKDGFGTSPFRYHHLQFVRQYATVLPPKIPDSIVVCVMTLVHFFVGWVLN